MNIKLQSAPQAVVTPVKELTDEELAVAYSKGNNKAFDLLLERNKKKLFTYIMFVVRNEEIANDVFQDTFVKIIVRLQSGEYQPTGKFSAWMTRIAHNVIMDHYRANQYLPTMDVDDENNVEKLEGAELSANSAEVYAINEQILADVKNLMENLPALQREVVFMRYFQDMSFKEIAEATGVSINTSLGRMRYAVINMRRMVRRHDIELQLQ